VVMNKLNADVLNCAEFRYELCVIDNWIWVRQKLIIHDYISVVHFDS
jgi:hypothetical protein